MGQTRLLRVPLNGFERLVTVPQAEVRFLMGGTQTNQIMIDSLLQSYQGVIAAKTGHVSVHEAGAIEFGGHKVLELDTADGKLTAQQIKETIEDYWADGNHEHMVMPGMVYISQPTELGTLYSREELEAIAQVCRKHDVKLFCRWSTSSLCSGLS